MAHTRGCVGLEGVDAMPLRSHDVKMPQELQHLNPYVLRVISLMVVIRLCLDSVDNS